MIAMDFIILLYIAIVFVSTAIYLGAIIPDIFSENLDWFLTPKDLYESTTCNALGVGLLYIVLVLICPIYFIIGFIWWLCHVGRK